MSIIILSNTTEQAAPVRLVDEAVLAAAALPICGLDLPSSELWGLQLLLLIAIAGSTVNLEPRAGILGCFMDKENHGCRGFWFMACMASESSEGYVHHVYKDSLSKC